MQIYLVGGAVRDELLGRVVNDLDYVVIGGSIEQMKADGYQQVGADFPVFLHPQSKDEYALARTERKSGAGYKGFSVDFKPTVTLEEDLLRRDLTINAIAKADDGYFIDPFNGLGDLKNRQLRHVSEAFIDDPLRVLRVARFAAQLNSFGFAVHPDTLLLMKRLALSGELSHLTPERVFKETEKALLCSHPEVYFKVLKDCAALSVLFPELAALDGVPQTAIYPPEVDTFVHTMMVLEQATQLSDLPEVRWAAAVHDLGKGVTDAEISPRHVGHEKAGIERVKALNSRYKVPLRYSQLAEKVTEYHLTMHQMMKMPADDVVKLIERLDGFRKPQILEPFILACEADARGRTGFEQRDYPAADFLRQAHQVCCAVTGKPFVEQGFKGLEIKQAINQERIRRVVEFKRDLTYFDIF
jgi:tRNA nucleotidyltransferase (CCA-adding enzyme)